MLKKSLLSILKAYRPIDARLRRNRLYEKVSKGIFSRVRPFVQPPARGNRYLSKLDGSERNPNAILFESYWGRKIAGNPLALFRALSQHYPIDEYTVYWTLQKGRPVPNELKKFPQIRFVDPKTPAYEDALLTATYLVNNVTFPDYFIRQEDQVYCNTWHGIPLKAMGRDMRASLSAMANSQRNFLQANVLPSSSTYFSKKVLDPYDVGPIKHAAVLPVGTARVDDTLSAKIDLPELRRTLGAKAGQKVVLYAPTWRGEGARVLDSFDDQFKTFSQICDLLGDEYFVVFSAHQHVKVPADYTIESGALLDETHNINDVLATVDVLVTDYSSILFDFLPLDRPIVLLTPDLERYESERGLYLLPNELPCTAVRSLPDLRDAIIAAKAPSQFPNFVECVDRFIKYENGEAAPAILKAMFSKPLQANVQQETRKRILFSPGGMLNNGITASLRNLIANLDYDLYDPYVIIDARVLDKDINRMTQLQKLDPRCKWILRYGAILVPPQQRELYNRYMAGAAELSDTELDTVKAIFKTEARRIMGDAHFDVAIDFGGYSPFWAGIISQTSAKQHCIYQHNHLWAELQNKAKNHKQLASVFQIYHDFESVISVSDETRDVNNTHLGHYYKKGVQAVTVENALDAARIRARADVPLGFNHPRAKAALSEPGVTSFLSLGRLSQEKRFDRLIRAFAKVAQNNPKAILFICGSGELRAKLEQMINAAELDGQVFLLGQVANPHNLLKHCDYCVLASDYEGQPMTLLEAMTLNVPCIGTDIPGIRSVLKNGVGTLAQATDDGFAKVLQQAIDGTLQPTSPIDVDAYVANAMQQFYERACSQAIL